MDWILYLPSRIKGVKFRSNLTKTTLKEVKRARKEVQLARYDTHQGALRISSGEDVSRIAQISAGPKGERERLEGFSQRLSSSGPKPMNSELKSLSEEMEIQFVMVTHFQDLEIGKVITL